MPEDATTPLGSKPQTLEELWIDPFDIDEIATASGLSRPSVSNVFIAFILAKWTHDRDEGSFPNELATFELRGKTHYGQRFKAADFVRLIKMDEMRRALRARIGNKFGERAEEVALQLADYLEQTYPAKDN